MKRVSYSKARETLADLWDEIEESQEEVILHRRGHEDLAMLPAQELRSLQETVHLLRSPRNAQRLFEALEGSRSGKNMHVFSSIEELAAAVGLKE